jgi:putative phage-type endonuclease
MKTIDLVQGGPEWLAWRNAGIGASEASTVAGISPYKTPWRLGQELRFALTDGKEGFAPEDLSNNPNVKAGKENEDKARQFYETLSDDPLFPGCGEHETYGFLRASLDGVKASGGPAEFKAPHFSTFREVMLGGASSNAYLHYWWQVQHQIFVLDAQEGTLFFWLGAEVAEDRTVSIGSTVLDADDWITRQVLLSVDGGAYQQLIETFPTPVTLHVRAPKDGKVEMGVEFPIARDDDKLSEYVDKAQAFWDAVVAGNPPPRDPWRDPYAPQTEEDVLQWQSLTTAWRQVKAAIKAETDGVAALTTKRKVVDKRLLALSTPYPWAAGGGLKLTRWWREGQVKGEDLQKDLKLADAELAPFRKDGHLVVRITDKQASEVDTEEDVETSESCSAELLSYWENLLKGKDAKAKAKEEGFTANTSDVSDEWDGLAANRRQLTDEIGEATAAIKKLKEQRQAVEQLMFAMMGAFATADADGVLVTKYWSNGKVDWPAVIAARGLPASHLEKHRGPGSVGYTISFPKQAVPVQPVPAATETLPPQEMSRMVAA